MLTQKISVIYIFLYYFLYGFSYNLSKIDITQAFDKMLSYIQRNKYRTFAMITYDFKEDTDMSEIKQPASALSSPRFCNMGTFMRMQKVDTAEGLDFAIAGAPFDTGSSFRSGSRFGPNAIRNISAMMKPNNVIMQVNIMESLKGGDIGDFNITPGYIHPSYDAIEKGVAGILEKNACPIVLGGDHAITLAELRAVAKKYGPVALVHFDSHSDLCDEVFGQKYNHGTPFRRAIEEGLIDPSHSIQIGMRGSLYDPNEHKMAAELGMKLIPAHKVREMGLPALIETAIERVGDKPCFLTFDIDFIDPAYAPGTGTPEVGGFTSLEGLELVRALKDLNFVGFDIVGSLIMGSLYAPTVVTGIHQMYTAIDIGQLAKYGVTYWLPLASAANVAQGAAALAVAVKSKDQKIKSLALPSSLSAFMGITEPAIFGVNLRFFKPFIAGCIGGGCGALYASLVHLGAKGTGVTGIFGILLCLNQPLQYVIEMAIAVGVAFAVSFALYKDKKKEPVAEAPVTVAASVEETDSEESAASETKTASDNTKTTSSEEVLNAPVNGKIIPNDQIADDTFAAEVLGKTVAIEPADGIITAPCDGEIVSIFDTGHAVCILTDGGAELLIHVGIDTVKMDGTGFTKKVSDGAKVHAGDVLIKADLNAIKEAGHPATTMMILTNTDLYDSVECAAPGTVTGKSSVMKLTK